MKERINVLCDITKSWLPELPILAQNFWKVEQAKEVQDGLSSFLGVHWQAAVTCDCLKAVVVNFTSYGPFSTTAEISFKGPRRLSVIIYLYEWQQETWICFGGIARHVWWQKGIQHFWWYVVTLLVSRLAPSLNAPVTFPFIYIHRPWLK